MWFYSIVISPSILANVTMLLITPVSKLLVFQGSMVWAPLTICLFRDRTLLFTLSKEQAAYCSYWWSLSGCKCFVWELLLNLSPCGLSVPCVPFTAHHVFALISVNRFGKSIILLRQAHYIRWQYCLCKCLPLARLVQVEATASVNESGCISTRCNTLPAASQFML